MSAWRTVADARHSTHSGHLSQTVLWRSGHFWWYLNSFWTSIRKNFLKNHFPAPPKPLSFLCSFLSCLKCLSVLYLHQHSSEFSVDPGHALQSSGSWLSQGNKLEPSSLKGTLILAVIFILQKAFGWSICIKISHPKYGTCSLEAVWKIHCSRRALQGARLGRSPLSPAALSAYWHFSCRFIFLLPCYKTITISLLQPARAHLRILPFLFT